MQVKPKSWTVDIVVGPVTGKSHARQHTPGSKHAPAAKREPVYDREKIPPTKMVLEPGHCYCSAFSGKSQYLRIFSMPSYLPKSALPFVWILLQGSPRGCYKSPVTPWTPSVMHMVWPPAWILQVWTPFHHQPDDLQNLSPRHPKPPTARSPMCLQPHPPQVKMTPPHGWLIPLLHPAGSHCQCLHRQDNTAPRVVNPTHSTSKDQDANLSPSHRQHGRRCAFNHIHHRWRWHRPTGGWFHSSIQRGSHCQCLHRQDNTAPRVVNPTHSTSKDQDANLSPSHRQHGRRCAFNHIHHRWRWHRPTGGWFHSSIQRGSHCQCLHRQDNPAPRVVNPTPTSKGQDDKFSFLRL